MSEPGVPGEPMGAFDRVVGALFDPKPAFTDIAARPSGWWVPLLLFTLLVLGFTFAFSQRVGWERFMRQQIESSPRARDLPAEQREQIIEQQLRFVPIVAQIQAAVAPTVLALVVAGVFLFVFNILLGAQLVFRQAFAVVCYGLLPQAVGSIVALAILFLKDPADFDLQNPVASNLGAFLNPDTVPRWLVSMGSSIDLFVIWSLLLLATGFAAAARKLSWSKALTWVLATWGVWLVVKVGWVWIFS